MYVLYTYIDTYIHICVETLTCNSYDLLRVDVHAVGGDLREADLLTEVATCLWRAVTAECAVHVVTGGAVLTGTLSTLVHITLTEVALEALAVTDGSVGPLGADTSVLTRCRNTVVTVVAAFSRVTTVALAAEVVG